MEDIRERFIKILNECYNGNQSQIASKLGLTQGHISNIVNRGSKPSADIIAKIVEVSDISPAWLLTGKGSMLNTEVSIPAINQEYKGAPYYNVDFIGGFDLVANDQTTMPDYYINYEPYNKDGVMWCNVTGHSMEPEINHGDTIAIKELKDWQTYLPFGEVYGIVTTEHRTIKRVSKSDKEGFMRLIPTNKNPEFAAQDIPLTIVMKVFQVLGSVKRFS